MQSPSSRDRLFPNLAFWAFLVEDWLQLVAKHLIFLPASSSFDFLLSFLLLPSVVGLSSSIPRLADLHNFRDRLASFAFTYKCPSELLEFLPANFLSIVIPTSTPIPTVCLRRHLASEFFKSALVDAVISVFPESPKSVSPLEMLDQSPFNITTLCGISAEPWSTLRHRSCSLERALFISFPLKLVDCTLVFPFLRSRAASP